MSNEKFQKLLCAISQLLIAQSQKTKTVPRCEENKLVSGAMRVVCTSSYSRHWLERNVPKIAASQLWPGATLSVINFDNLPKPIKCSVFLPSIQAPNKGSLLEASNEDINTGGWSVLHRESKNGGTFMQLGIDGASRDILEAHDFKLFCGLGGKATFKMKGKEPTQPKPRSPRGSNQNPKVPKETGGDPPPSPK